jgi:signal transduction histidine kinase
MYFGGKDGLDYFNPAEIRENETPPSVIFTNFLIFNKPVPVSPGSVLKKHISMCDAIELSYKHSVITFEYTAINYTNSAKNEYAYMMEGFDNNWYYAGNERKASYTNLDPGEYIFRVKASNNDGVWNEQGIALQIVITPPFWQTGWFRTLLLIAFIAGIYTIYKIRVRSMEEQKRVLEIKVRDRTKDLEIAKRETDDILQNVRAGLFLLDKNYCIESQYSTALEDILEEKEPARKNFPDFLMDLTEKSVSENTKNYMEILFNDSIDEEMLLELNPLANAEFLFDNGKTSGVKSKFLAFNFRRVVHDNKTQRIIATVNDITEKVQLEKNLEETREAGKRKMDILLSILNVEPAMLHDFVKSAQDEIDHANAAVRKLEQKNHSNEILDEVYRSIHTIKGNASLLELDFMAEKAHKAEDEIANLIQQKKISAKDIKRLADNINMLNELLGEVKGLIDQFGKIQNQFRHKRTHDHELLKNSLNNLVKNLGDEFNKKTKLSMKDFNADIIPGNFRLALRDILVQLVRNSMYHGIENAEVRKKMNKPGIGLISISNFIKDNTFGIKLRDDGQGLKYAEIREMAKKSGKWDVKEIEKWDNKRLTEIIFESGITTSRDANKTAGRGVGMDIIKKKITNAGGKINIKSEEGKYCEFVIEIPLKNLSKNKIKEAV